jgi:hypothetical protein
LQIILMLYALEDIVLYDIMLLWMEIQESDISL